MDFRVIVGSLPAHILLTGQNSAPIKIEEPMMPLLEDVPCEELPLQLPLQGTQSCGAHWGAMIHYKENRAPSVYIPNHDWRHSVVCSRLSPGVRVVGTVHSDDPLHYDHVARLGRYRDAILSTADALAGEVIFHNPALLKRVSTIPIAVPVPEHMALRKRGRCFRLMTSPVSRNASRVPTPGGPAWALSAASHTTIRDVPSVSKYGNGLHESVWTGIGGSRTGRALPAPGGVGGPQSAQAPRAARSHRYLIA
jgi:hypothetical protein